VILDTFCKEMNRKISVNHVNQCRKQGRALVGSRSFHGPLCLVAVWASALLVLGLPRYVGADTIYKTDTSVIREIKITKASWKVVNFELKGVPQSVESANVERIERDSRYIDQARAQMKKGQYPQALKSLGDAAKAGGAAWEAVEIAYLKGAIYLDWGGQDKSRIKSARKAFESFLKKFGSGDDFYVPFGTLGLAKALELADQPKSARGYYSELSKFGGIWKMRGSIGEGRSIVKSNGDSAAAQRIFNQIIKDDRAPDLAREEAAVWSAFTLVKLDRFDEAERLLDRRFFNPRGTAVRYNDHYAQACNVMGDVFLGKNDSEQAELWFLRTTCFFRNKPVMFRSAVERLVDLYEKQGKPKRAEQWSSQLRRSARAEAPSKKTNGRKKKAKRSSKKKKKGKKSKDATR
jgi:tetratricopeptide (TPR) repeat protein